jgi:hypothetical protein
MYKERKRRCIIMDELTDKSGGTKVYPRPPKDNPPEEDEEAETGKPPYSYNLYRELLQRTKDEKS